jgi:sulfatase maturation enzyme AslB (radical SAM superfamily)
LSKTFCPLPWNGISAKNNGDLRLCCNTDYNSRDRSVLRKDNGEIFNSGKDDWNEARNSQLLKDVRKTMLAGNWHPECIRCQTEESHGLKTLRVQESSRWALSADNVKSFTAEDGTIDVTQLPIDYIDVRYGNFCNLKCRMCAPTDSHKWYDDFVKLTGQTHFMDGEEKVHLKNMGNGTWTTEKYNWFKGNNTFTENLYRYAPQAKLLYVVGGEPLIIDQHKKDLQEISRLGDPSAIEIRYSSNLTHVENELIQIWKRFKRITVYASTDGIGDVFNYQRTPANWNTVFNNLKKLDQIENLRGYLFFTITALNVFHFPEFYEWWATSGLKKFRPVNNQCHTPVFYCIKILPEHIKEQIGNHYRSFDLGLDYKERCAAILEYMNSEDNSNLLPKFIQVTKKLDEIRKQNISTIVPQYTELFQ